MHILPVALMISLTQVVFFGACGLGLARLLLQGRLRPHQFTLAPVFGLALLAIVGYYGTNAGLTLRHTLPLALVLAVLLLGASLVFSHGGEERETARWRSVLPGTLPMPELVPLLLLMLATWGVSILPTLNYGTLIPIGHNWDVEFYLPLADYLKEYSYLSLDQAPANPLRDLLLSPRLSARAMGATYAQGMADLLLFREAWDSFVPLLALLRALTLAGLYALLREGFRTSISGALAGTALAALNGLLLWTTYNSFLMGIGGLALLPAALLCTLLALEERSPRATLATILLLGGITCTYWPMLMAYGAGGLGVGAALLWEGRRSRAWLGVVGRGALVLAGGALVGVLVHLRAADAFLGVFSRQVASMGVTSFISPGVIAGSAPFSHRELETLTFSGLSGLVLAWGGAAVVLLLVARGAGWGSKQRSLAVGVAVCSLAYLLGLRFVVGFPYGYLRGASYINTLLLGLAGAGAFLPRSSEDSHTARPSSTAYHLAIIPPVLLGMLLAISATASYHTYRVYGEQPGVFGLETVEMRAAAAALPREGPVYVSPAPHLRGPYMGALAYTLRERELLGIVATGYQVLVNTPVGATPAFVVAQPGEDPRAYGYEMQTLWQDERATLYAAPAGRLAWLSGRPTLYTEGALLQAESTYSRAQAGTGPHMVARPDHPLYLYVGSTSIRLEPPPPGSTDTNDTPTPRSLTLALASYVEQPVIVTLNGNEQRLHISPGAAIYHTSPITPPLALTLRGQHTPLILRWASLHALDSAEGTAAEQGGTTTLTPLDDTLLLGVDSEPHEQGAAARLHIANPTGEQTRLAVEIYEEVAGYDTDPRHYAWALFPLPSDGTHTLDLNLLSPAFALNGEALPVQTGTLGDGRYFAALWVYQGEQARRVLPFLRFERTGETIHTIEPLNINAAFALLQQPARPLDGAIFHAEGAEDAASVTLRGFELAPAQRLRPGQQARVSLLWQAEQPPAQLYMVFAQVIDEENRKVAEWNGAAGGDWWPSPTWQAGQRVWQDVPLDIAADAAPGSYHLVVGLFNAASGERLRLPDGSDMLVLSEIKVGE